MAISLFVQESPPHPVALGCPPSRFAAFHFDEEFVDANLFPFAHGLTWNRHPNLIRF
jgi:hypothetical protein